MNDYYTSEYSPLNSNDNSRVVMFDLKETAEDVSGQVPKQSKQNPDLDHVISPQVKNPSPSHIPYPKPTHDMKGSYINFPFETDYTELIKRVVKYLIEALAIGAVAYIILRKYRQMEIKDAVMIGITAALCYAILDTFSPSVSLGARFGTGFGFGQAIIGAPAMPAMMMK